jgi:hypothetical protein
MRRGGARDVHDPRDYALHLPPAESRPAWQPKGANPEHTSTHGGQSSQRRQHTKVIESATGDSRDCHRSGESKHTRPADDQAARVAFDRAEADPMSRRGRLEKGLQVSVRPLARCAFLPKLAAGIECFAQINDESLPLLVGELSIEIHAQSNSDREPEKLARRRPATQLNRPCSLSQLFGCDSDFAADVLKFRQRHPLARWELTLAGVLRFGRPLEYRRDFRLVESSVGHAKKIVVTSVVGKVSSGFVRLTG